MVLPKSVRDDIQNQLVDGSSKSTEEERNNAYIMQKILQIQRLENDVAHYKAAADKYKSDMDRAYSTVYYREKQLQQTFKLARKMLRAGFKIVKLMPRGCKRKKAFRWFKKMSNFLGFIKGDI